MKNWMELSSTAGCFIAGFTVLAGFLLFRRCVFQQTDQGETAALVGYDTGQFDDGILAGDDAFVDFGEAVGEIGDEIG